MTKFSIGTYNDHERTLHITGGGMTEPRHFHIAIEATKETAERIAAAIKPETEEGIDPWGKMARLEDICVEQKRELARLRDKLLRVSDAVVRAAVVKRPMPEEFWPTFKHRDQLWDIAYGYGAMDCLAAIAPAIKE